jgi:hypothetical protein
MEEAIFVTGHWSIGEDNIKTDIEETGCRFVGSSYMAQERIY